MIRTALLVIVTVGLMICCFFSLRDLFKYKKRTSSKIQTVILTISTILIGFLTVLSSNPETVNIVIPEIQKLYEEKEQLKEENSKLEKMVVNKESEISKQENELKKIKKSLNNIAKFVSYKMYLNDDELNIDISNSIAKINEKLFFSEDVLEDITKDSINEDKENRLIYIGKYPEEYVDLLTVCRPYDLSSGFELGSENSFKIQSKTYYDGFKLSANANEARTVKFNLRKKYSELSFNIGHIDETNLENTFTLRIYVDKKLIKEFACNSDVDINKKKTVPLNKGNTLMLEWICDSKSNSWADYGLVNLKLK